jgi:hypothetical protein
MEESDETPEGFICVVCAESQPSHSQTQRCRTCDYDVCMRCVAIARVSKALDRY